MNFLKKSQNHPQYGLQIFVGAGRTPSENETKAQSMGMGTLVDNDGKVKKALAISYYPTFLVIDGDRKVQMRDQEALDWANEHFASLILFSFIC